MVEEDGYYTLLLDSYEKNKKNLGDSVQEIMDVMSFSSSTAVSNYCLNEYCVFKSPGGVSIDTNLACIKRH